MEAEFNAASILADSPYLVDDGNEAVNRFKRTWQKAHDLTARSREATDRVNSLASQILLPYRERLRAEIVTESVRLEGYDVSPEQLEAVRRAQSEGLTGPRRQVVDAISDDPRVMAALGLYRAYEIADEWVTAYSRPREFEIRALHKELLSDQDAGGRYKSSENRIGLSNHVPVAPWDVPRAMGELCSWMVQGTGEPILDATIAHAWLTHIHPFDDGNGRIARLVANIALAQAGFAPLVLRSRQDREPYLEALAESDEGPIVKLYELFLRSVTKQVALMERPSYVESILRRDQLGSKLERYEAWSDLADLFLSGLKARLGTHNRFAKLLGLPDYDGFELLQEGRAAGNAWTLIVRADDGGDGVLVWCGFRSAALMESLGDRQSRWPSFFLSSSDRAPRPEMRWAPSDRAFEVSLAPMRKSPATVLTRDGCESMSIEDAVTASAAAIQSKLP